MMRQDVTIRAVRDDLTPFSLLCYRATASIGDPVPEESPNWLHLPCPASLRNFSCGAHVGCRERPNSDRLDATLSMATSHTTGHSACCFRRASLSSRAADTAHDQNDAQRSGATRLAVCLHCARSQ